ncbi:MAG: AI-2E family transporter [Eubacteriaceae bacterium]|nr:AI-2E family transporter [Eubacteriaceae bacterium]
MKKIKFDSKYLKISIYAAASLCCVILFLVLIYNISDVFEFIANVFKYLFALIKPVLWGFIIAYILYRPTRFFDKNLLKFKKIYIPNKTRKALSVIISVLLMLLIIFLIIYFAIPGIINSISQMIISTPQYMNNAVDIGNRLACDERFVNILNFFNIDISSSDKIREILLSWVSYLQLALEKLSGYIINFIVTTGNAILNFILSIFFAIYMLIDKDKLVNQISGIVKKISVKFYYKANYILILTDEMCYTFLTGKALCSLAITIFVLIPCIILNIKYAFLIAIIIGITNMIPVFGPIIGSIPAILLAMLTSPIYGIWVLIIIIVSQQIEENIIQPKILGDSIGINAFWVIFSIVIFGKFWGIAGMLLAVPIFGVLRILVKDWLRKPPDENFKEESVFEKELLDIKIARFYREKEFSRRKKKDFRKFQKNLRNKNRKN